MLRLTAAAMQVPDFLPAAAPSSSRWLFCAKTNRRGKGQRRPVMLLLPAFRTEKRRTKKALLQQPNPADRHRHPKTSLEAMVVLLLHVEEKYQGSTSPPPSSTPQAMCGGAAMASWLRTTLSLHQIETFSLGKRAKGYTCKLCQEMGNKQVWKKPQCFQLYLHNFDGLEFVTGIVNSCGLLIWIFLQKKSIFS